MLSAKLRLSPKGSSTTYAVHSVASTSWNEKTITWSTAPPLTAAVLATSAVAPDGWTEADVTSAVTTNGTISFGLDTTALNVSLSSRETGALAPRLVVVTASTVDDVAPTVTLVQPSDGSTSSASSPEFSGALGAAQGHSSTVTLRLYTGTSASGTPVLTRSATGTGSNWSVGAGTALSAGTYTAQAAQDDAAGNTGFSAAVTFTFGCGSLRGTSWGSCSRRSVRRERAGVLGRGGRPSTRRSRRW